MHFGKKRNLISTAALIIPLVFFANGCERLSRVVEIKSEDTDPKPLAESRMPESVHAAFGNPSNATSGVEDEDNFLVLGNGSVISYNSSRGTANWVSWRTVRSDLSTKITRPEFQVDHRLPPGFRKIGYSDYSGSGYDRGHLVPSADRFADPKLNEETFLMSNIVPQTKALNQYPWQQLESHARALARRGSDVYQIAGCYGQRERLRNRVTAPTNCWKVIAAVPRGKQAADVDPRMTVIAVDMPNTEGIENERWDKFRVTPRELEQRTGLDLFNHLPQPVQDKLETRVLMKSP